MNIFLYEISVIDISRLVRPSEIVPTARFTPKS